MRSFTFQIVLTKTYNTSSLMEDIRTLYKSAGHQRKTTVFLFTESEIKDEIFLELINSVLMTGEVAGLAPPLALSTVVRRKAVRRGRPQAAAAYSLRRPARRARLKQPW